MRYILLLLVLITTPLSAQFNWTEAEIPVRDGKSLAADFYSTDSTKAKPVILVQTPYNKNLYRLASQLPPEAVTTFPLDEAFHYVILDWRGFYGSRDAGVAGYDRGLDGYDAVEWIAAQPWCNGKVATWGPSALGAIQFQTARHHPPHLVCAVPLVKDFKVKYSDYYYGGEYRKSHVEALQKLGFFVTSLILDHPTNDFFVKVVESGSDYPEEFNVPMLVVGGWFDHYPDDVLRAFEDIRTRSSAEVRDQHKLIFGPWTHSGVDKAEQGELEYPTGANVVNFASLQFFHYHLLNAENSWQLKPTVRYFQLGKDRWMEGDSWTGVVAKTSPKSFYLRNSGVLSTNSIGGPDFPPVTFRYDPRDPSPTYGGSYFDPFNKDAAVGPYDQREVVESRNDAVIFSTEPLEQDLDVTGPISIELFVSSDRKDTDFGVRLCDVYPDGRSMLLTQGIRRMRFRDGFTPQDTSLITPGEVYKVTVELQNLAVTFKAGHQIRVIITGSNYPHFDVNPNTAAPLYQSPDSLVAINSIYMAPQYASRLVLPVPQASGVEHQNNINASSLQAYITPNLLQDRATLSLSLPTRSNIQIALFDLSGHQVSGSWTYQLEAGEQEIPLDLPTLSAGIYFLRTIVGEKVTSLPLVVE
ncbi:MAG: CocE/NonD family hydrolase [Ignavibacteriae bacterium]|nr:CocE/NonD family hydrolase [Ignavibacteriota bacterium]MCB9214640.1 CocE/NonD family hydrolase [Ignavibacteria bacterium]